MITCELMNLEDIAKEVGVVLEGKDYNKWQDYLQDHCTCQTTAKLKTYYGVA
jgi:hypothetical protein